MKYPGYLKYLCLSFTFFLIHNHCLHTQNESNVDLDGSLNLQLQAYNAQNLEPRRDDFSWRISGNPVLNIGEVSIPFNIIAGSFQSNLRQSFNRIGAQIQYKWVTAHLGHSRVNFSPLVLNRQYFLGGGIELNPSIFRFGFVYGRFRKPVAQGLSGVSQPSFSREGFSTKLGIGTANNFVDFIFLKAEDDLNSIDFEAQRYGIRPEENVVVGISTKQRFVKKMYFEAHGSLSLYNRDLRSSPFDSLNYSGQALLENIITLRRSSQFLPALKSSLTYRDAGTSIGLGYDRIAPDYRSMGIFFIQNDVERYTFFTKWKMAQKRMNVSLRFGVERNNLRDNRFYKNLRSIGSININYRIKKGGMLYASYSNLIQNAEIENLSFADTLVLEQVLNNAGAGFLFSINRPNINHQINFNGHYFISTNRHPGTEMQAQEMQMLSGQLTYSLNILQSGWSFLIGSQTLQTISDFRDEWRIGPQIGIHKSLANRKLFLGVRAVYFFNYRDESLFSKILRSSFTASYRIGRKHVIRLRVYSMNSNFSNSDLESFSELISDLHFRYVF